MDYENIIVDINGPIANITLNRPDQRNALNRAMRDEFRHLLANELKQCTVAVVTGNGPSFCAGMDLKEKVGFNEAEDQWEFFRALYDTDTILIGALNGPVRGAGLTFVTAFDIIIADPSVDFGLPQVTHGIFGGVAASMLTQVMPRAVLAEMVLTGIPLSGGRAREIGLINHIAEPGQFHEDAKKLAARIGGFKPEIMRIGRRMLKALPYGDGYRMAATREVKTLSMEALLNSRQDRKIDTKYGGDDPEKDES